MNTMDPETRAEIIDILGYYGVFEGDHEAIANAIENLLENGITVE